MGLYSQHCKEETGEGSLEPNKQTPCSMGELVIKKLKKKKKTQDGEIPKINL